ncbi:hypothetical protein PR048_005504 [Dryococelus australis]|uniref:Uncharacterized protein n=1 Tax=Dryococelus australis TaxID=614101 RepID=A0ABQ9I8G2_9NEOP|nr:hypothetical protein PR048_005504 [Dryococelus australis]
MYDLKHDKALEQYIGVMYECTRQLNASMEDELSEVILGQLPSHYQDRWSDRPFINFNNFRDQILCIDQSEQLKISGDQNNQGYFKRNLGLNPTATSFSPPVSGSIRNGVADALMQPALNGLRQTVPHTNPSSAHGSTCSVK